MEERKKPTIVVVAAIGSLLLGFCCCGQGGVMAGMPVFFGWHKKVMKSAMEPLRAKIAAQRQALEEKRAATTDQQEIAAIDQEMAQLDRQAPPDLDPFYEAVISPAASRCYVFEGLSALVTNLLIFMAGFGLLGLKSWSRKLAIWASAGRILAGLIYGVLAITVVMPAMAEGMRKFQESMADKMPAGPGQPPMPDMTAMMTVQGSVGAVVGVLVAIAWPVALLIMLNTKAAREALAPGAEERWRQQGADQGTI